MGKFQDLKQKEEELVEKIEKKRIEIGAADSAMQSRFPTGRFELENYIELLETQLKEIREEIMNLEA